MRYTYCYIFVLCFSPLFAAEPLVDQVRTAAVSADWAVVRSGPGEEFYPTSQLRNGEKVEVYYKQDEWCAIRPPIGSFSWVSAQFIDLGTGNNGTVLAEGLASRIGSNFSDDCETIQVTLQKGESVFILERREMPENSTSPVWLKIVPPNGEFRWIHQSALEPSIRQVQYDTTIGEIPESPTTASPDPSIPIPKIASAHLSGSIAPPVTRPSPLQDVPFQQAFNGLRQEAYGIITRPAEDEVFAALIQRADELHRLATTDQDLEKTYHLLESLQRTRLVRRELTLRRAATNGVSPSTVLPNSNQIASISASNSGIPSSRSEFPRQSIVPAYVPTAAQTNSLAPNGIRAGVNVGGYDIVGRLGEFESPPKGHPPCAVVDEKDQIICLISPSANLDLSSYVGKFVGINGVLGFYERQQGKPLARHITARNIQVIR